MIVSVEVAGLEIARSDPGVEHHRIGKDAVGSSQEDADPAGEGVGARNISTAVGVEI